MENNEHRVYWVLTKNAHWAYRDWCLFAYGRAGINKNVTYWLTRGHNWPFRCLDDNWQLSLQIPVILRLNPCRSTCRIMVIISIPRRSVITTIIGMITIPLTMTKWSVVMVVTRTASVEVKCNIVTAASKGNVLALQSPSLNCESYLSENAITITSCLCLPHYFLQRWQKSDNLRSPHIWPRLNLSNTFTSKWPS